MATASDLAEWWEKNRKYTGEWADRGLSAFVDEHPNFFGVVVATAGRTAIEFPMAIGAGFVDILNLGKGTAEGGWGYLQDGLRFVSAVAPLARGGQAIISRVLAMGTEGNCAWIATAKALMQTGTKTFASIGTLTEAGGAASSGVETVSQLVNPIRKIGGVVNELPQPATMSELVAAAKANPNGSLIFGIRWNNAAFAGPGNPAGSAGHALVASWDAARGFMIADRTGKVVTSLAELEKFYPGIGGANLSGGLIAIKNAMIPQAALIPLGTSGSILDALAMEVAVVFSPTPQAAAAIRRQQGTVTIGEPIIIGTGYTVKLGDWLSKISQDKYRNKRDSMFLWPIIYDANKSVIGNNPNMIRPGQKLIIPDISSYNEVQLDQVRRKGRAWR